MDGQTFEIMDGVRRRFWFRQEAKALLSRIFRGPNTTVRDIAVMWCRFSTGMDPFVPVENRHHSRIAHFDLMRAALMIVREKMSAALFAIHSVLVKARWLAGEQADFNKIYALLDHAEMLPTLLSQRQDATAEFRQALVRLGESLPECAGFVQDFDRGIAATLAPNLPVGSEL